MFSTKHQLWDLWFYHNVDLGSGRCYTADDSSGDQLWEDKSSLLGPSFECLSTITHNAFMCVNIEAGGVWLRPGGRFHHVLMTRQICRVPQMEASKTSEISKFLLLIRFLKLLPRGRRGWGGRVGREGKNQESLKRFIKGIKNLKATPSVSIKGPVDEENPDMQLILTRTLLTRQLSMQKKKKKCAPKQSNQSHNLPQSLNGDLCFAVHPISLQSCSWRRECTEPTKTPPQTQPAITC